jgi:molybdopterin adenylyltransferase
VPDAHRHEARGGPPRYLVVTVSTGRHNRRAAGEEPADESGDAAQELIEGAGGKVAERRLVPDDAKLLRSAVSRALRDPGLDAIVLTGGTGVSSTDVTIETVRPLLEKEIEGFGELFRAASYRKIGAAAALSRATAGVAKGKVVMCLPGAPDAVRTALGLFLGEVRHILHLTRGR